MYRYDYCNEICDYDCLITSYFFWIVNFLGLASPKWFFSLFKEFLLYYQNICVLYFSHFIFWLHVWLITHTLEVIFIFHKLT
jgi:hypothetical protein